MPTYRTEAPDILVRIDGVQDIAWRPLSVSQTTGAASLNTAVLEYNLQGLVREDIRLQNTTSIANIIGNKTCEIYVKENAALGAGAPYERIHFGRIVAESIEADQDRITIKSRFDRWMFGYIKKTKWRHDGGATLDLVVDAEMNPLVDGRLFQNYDAGNECFIDTDSAEHDDWSLWTIRSAAEYLIKEHLDTSHVLPPLSYAALSNSTELLRGFKINVGDDVAGTLDRLLGQFGYQWRINYKTQRIEFVKKSAATAVHLKMSEVGDRADMEFPVYTFSINSDLAKKCVDSVEVIGQPKVFESTFTLVPAWLPIYDSREPEELTPAEVDGNPELKRVYRDWVLNENGDYNGIGRGYSTFDLRAHFGNAALFLRKRKRFQEMVTLDWNKTPLGRWQGCEVEYYGTNGWTPIDRATGVSCQLLTKECGIRFSNPVNSVEEFLAIANGNPLNLQIRITASVESCEPVFGSAILPDSHFGKPGAGHKPHVIHSREYNYRKVWTNSERFGAGFPTSEVDGQADAVARAAFVLEQMSPIAIEGTVRMNGVDLDLDWFGKSLAAVQPRNVTFNAAQPSEPARYPNILGADFDFRQQTTTLRVGTT